MNQHAILEFERRKAALKKKFFIALRDRIKDISSHLQNYSENNDVSSLQACRYHFHKTAGVAAAFGYPELGLKAREICIALKKELVAERQSDIVVQFHLFLSSAEEILRQAR